MIFVDTSFFVALLVPTEKHHRAAADAVAALGKVDLSRVLLTTNNVILETVTIARYRADHRTAVRAADLLYAGKMATVYRSTAEDEAKAVTYLRRHDDKIYSLVDCLSFVVMLDRGITEAFAFDDDFSHRFVMRPGKSRK